MPDPIELPLRQSEQDDAAYWRRQAREAQCEVDWLKHQNEVLGGLLNLYVRMIRLPVGPGQPTHFSIIADQRAYLVTVTEWMPQTSN